ncbi:MAG TPA: cation diffusion facilitator family transporter [Firmicutes bacterium]|nr:cation diffusion facilitator family transporter [Bacillota bacterium]
MFGWLTKIFIKDRDNTSDPHVRESYGKLTGITGIILNIILCASKIVTGLITGAISVVSDGINNLSDAASSIITLVGFKLSAKKPDKEHPFGHGRMEYFAGLLVSLIILLVAFELFSESLQNIIDGTVPSFASENVRIITICVLGASILVKLWMALFNRYCGKKINSVAMQATAADSATDCISTAVVLVCTVLTAFVGNFPIDAIAGIVVAIFIFYTGIKSVKSILDLLLGKAPDPELVREIADYVVNFDSNIVGVHDLIVHDYGPGRKMITLHAEVPAEGNMVQLHEIIDSIERGLAEHYNCLATIHMDPVVTTSERVNMLKAKCVEIVKSIDPGFSVHDFRVSEGKEHSNVIFDVVLTRDTRLTNAQIEAIIRQKLAEYDKTLCPVVEFDLPFV